ncbi:MAG: tRNA preQ1(34) S-adenosylmethionine ribosyltransferase-isomerase QueA [Phycisphaerales bacterium]|nr:tRNA preQ1(34) S-adenosylmethionine ribosyltransferase-isomerase QueA [Planctomycetota bacterium]MCH8508862.1 tRNA preQ1(34) S-adenosylmethionine ribosyltransferase-isomerase QueA [Phycisphaerales bacterium]
MRTDALDFELPRELIATRPASPRDSSRLLVVSRSDPGRLEDRVFTDLPGLLGKGDTLVFNRSRVIPARLEGVNPATGGRVSGLYLKDAGAGPDGRAAWVVLLKAKRSRPGGRVALTGADGRETWVVLELVERCPAEGPGAWVVVVEGAASVEVLERVGLTPLPPYILSARKERGEDTADELDRSFYQTVYAGEPDEAGSVAAPTAGLHFTDRVLADLAARGVGRREVVLHVGAGTFRPVEAERLEDHPMHAERCWLATAGDLLRERACSSRTKSTAPGGRVIAVGSTSVRTLEAAAGLVEAGRDEEARGWFETDILIAPGYRWKAVDGMVTNFHLPRSTLIAMVAAALEGDGIDGVERVKAVYAHAVKEGYRFFSYGDAMLVLP